MKINLLFLTCIVSVAAGLSSCGSSQSTSNALSKPETEVEHLKFAEEISRKLLDAQSKGGFYALTEDEATPEMVNGLNATLQKSSYQQIKSALGNYNGLRFHEMVVLDEHAGLEIYRFKGDFSSKLEVEVRTVLDQSGRLAGFFVKPWRDEL